MNRTPLRTATLALLLAVVTLVGCDDGPVGPGSDRPFVEGTDSDPRIGLVVNSSGNALRFFQLGSPETIRVVPLGASSSVTPTGLSVRGRKVAVPLGNAASVAVIDAAEQSVERFFLFPSGNATGSAFAEDGSLLLANLTDDEVGRVTLGQAGDAIEQTVDVAPAPTDIEIVDGRALVISGNLDQNFVPLGPGVVTALDPTTLEVLGTAETGGTNPNDAAVGPDGLLYVVNTGNYVDPGSIVVIDPATLARLDVIDNAGVGPGSIAIGDDGLAYISGFFFGTLVLDTETRTFVRGPDDPLCAPLEDGGCRGAFDSAVTDDGTVYQLFFGSTKEGLAPWVFVYEPGSFALADSIDGGLGPSAIEIRIF